MAKVILLTRGYCTIVDDKDYKILRNYKWHAHVDQSGYVYAKRKFCGKHVAMHREIMNVETSSIIIDHKNHDTLDNRRCNLRYATKTENCRNRKVTAGQSQYKGVRRKSNGWEVRIRSNGKDTYIGRSKDEAQAAKMYDEAAIKHFGEFACLNFPN